MTDTIADAAARSENWSQVFDKMDDELARIPVLEAQVKNWRAIAANLAQCLEAADGTGAEVFTRQKLAHGFTETD